MQIKTVTTTDGVNTVDFGNTSDKFYWIKNIGSTTVYASTKSDVAAGADGTAEITAGGCAMLENYDSIVYISGAGKVEIHETNSDVCPFKVASADYSSDISAIEALIPAEATPGNQLADKAYVSAMQSGSPYVYMKQAEYEALTEYEPDRLYWVTYPLSNQHLVWCNGECVSSEGLQPYANPLTSASTVDTDFRYYAAIAYNPIGVQRQNQSWASSFFSTNLKKIDIAKGVTTIGSGAFCNCSGLVDISIPDSVTTIGSSAFEKCHSLKSIVIPDSVTGTLSAFSNCTSLVDIKISKNVTEISGFGNCTSLKNIIIPANAGLGAFSDCTNLETAKFLQGVTTIGQEIFRSCTSLTSVIIPDSVTTIGAYIFRNCTNEIHVYYTGTQTQWNAVNKSYWGGSLGTGGSIVMHYEYVEEETEVI